MIGKDIQKTGAGDTSRPIVTIGVLGLQGDFQMHLEMLSRIPDVEARIVKTIDEISQCDGLIIPGGESTTVGKLMDRYGIDEAIRKRAAQGMAVFGTCTGMILLSTEIEGSNQHRLGLIDITVKRNAFGRQVDSFETDLNIDCLSGGSLRMVFIRAPYATAIRGDVEVLATLDSGEIIFVRQGNYLGAAFHPELTDDTRVHEYFVEIARSGVAAARN